MPFTRVQTIATGDIGGYFNVERDLNGQLVALTNGSGNFMLRFLEDGSREVLQASGHDYLNQTGEIQVLSDGRYVLSVPAGFPFGNERGTLVQIVGRDGVADTGMINAISDGDSSGYVVRATAGGGFSVVYTDLSRSQDSFTVTFPQTYDFPHTSEQRTADQDVRSIYFDASGNPLGGSTVADDAVETVENGTANRRVYNQGIFDSTLLSGGATAYVYVDNRHEGSNSVYGGAEVFSQLSLVVEGPNGSARGIRVDDNPLHSGGPNGDLNNSSEIDGATGANIVALPDGTLAVIWQEGHRVRDESVYGHYRVDGTDSYVRYFAADGAALTDPTVFLHRSAALGNISDYVWAEALPDGRIAVAYNDGVYGANGTSMTDAYLGVLGALGADFTAQRVNDTAALSSDTYAVSDLTVDSNGYVEIVYNDAGDRGDGYNLNVQRMDRFSLGIGIDGQVIAGAGTINGTGLGDQIGGSAAVDTISAGAGNDTVFAQAGNDVVDGGAGADKLYGNEGNDVLRGGSGGDVLRGGEGIDTASYAGSAAGVSVNLATGAASGGDAAGDTLFGIENVLGSSSADALVGDAGANGLTGGSGNDVLNGYLGDDTLDGGSGADKASYKGATSAVSVNLSLAGGQETGGGGFDTLISIENLLGTSFADTLVGNAGANALSGDAGADILNGGAGNDTLDGGAGIDKASYKGAAAAVRVDLSATGVQDTGGAGHDKLIAIENVLGSSYADTLIGSAVANTLWGDAGNDVINGGGGSDTLSGGSGRDTFRFTTTLGASNIDTITDFTVGSDAIVLARTAFVGMTAGALSAAAFYIGAAAHDGDDRIIYNAATGALLFDRDGSGAGYAAVQFATIGKNAALTAASFTVI